MNTLVHFIQNTSSFGSKIALQIKQEKNYFKITYQELHDSSQKIAIALKNIGIRKGDRIGIMTENHPFWGLAFFGVLWAGGAVVPIDSKLKDHSIQNIVHHSECKVIFTSSKFKSLLLAIVEKAPSQPKLVVLDEETSDVLTLSKFISTAKESGAQSLEKVRTEDLAIILYTSGTTGSPKGVMLTHHNIASNVESVSSIFPFFPNDQFVSCLPLCHTYAITADFLIPIHMGITVTYVENLKGPTLIERMQENKATVLVAVPALIQLMYHQIKAKINALSKVQNIIFKTLRVISKTSQWIGLPIGHILFKPIRNRLSPAFRFFISGGAPIDPEIIEEFSLLGIPIYQGYGLTETSPILTVNTPTQNAIGSVGRPIPGVQIKIENGEIIARGPNIMKGYYHNPKATSEILKEGWLHTGDIGFFDAQGFLHISGRMKNVIVTRGGKNVYPEELEEELGRHSWIKEACVVGLKKESKDFKMDEWVYALLVPNLEVFRAWGIEPGKIPRNNSEIESKLQETIKETNLRVADYKRIRGFEIWDELPKTTTLKLKRKEIFDLLQQKGAQPIGGALE